MSGLRTRLDEASDIELGFMMLGICTLLAVPLLLLGYYPVVAALVVLCPVLIAIVTSESETQINLVDEIDDWRRGQDSESGPESAQDAGRDEDD